jgi:hypothetical protein
LRRDSPRTCDPDASNTICTIAGHQRDGIAFDPSGNLTFMDQENQVVRQVDPAGNMQTIVGRCVIEAADRAMHPPVRCPGSEKYVCSAQSDVQMDCVANYAQGGTDDGTALCTPASSGDGGPALQARLDLPYLAGADPSGRLAYTPRGDLIFAETSGHRIRMVDAETGRSARSRVPVSPAMPEMTGPSTRPSSTIPSTSPSATTARSTSAIRSITASAGSIWPERSRAWPACAVARGTALVARSRATAAPRSRRTSTSRTASTSPATSSTSATRTTTGCAW